MRSEFWGGDTWSDLLDGQETITIFYPAFVSTAQIVDYGSAVLNNATLIIEGTVIPEPASLLLLGTGLLGLISKRGRK